MRNQHLKDLSYGPMNYVKEWHTYFVNGYKFHTQAWTKGKKIINSGVHVKGLTEGATDDFYGIIQHIYELEYNSTSYPKRVVLFCCDWFDPTSRGTRVNLNMALWKFEWIKDIICLSHSSMHIM